MTTYAFTLREIVSWYRAKQRLLAGSDVTIGGIREREEFVPAAAADFNGPGTMGRINGWASGEFDFEAVRISDGEDVFWRHVNATSLEDLEEAYSDFVEALRGRGHG